MLEVGKKYNKRTLFRMRQFYNLFKNEKVSPLVTLLTWSHYLQLLPLKDMNKIHYYINECVTHKLSKRELIEKIKSNEYERLSSEAKNKLANKENLAIQEIIKDPIIIKNNINKKIISEKMLQILIMEDIPSFLEELGTGFTFIKNEYKKIEKELYLKNIN